jgi:hypothetical protein
LIHFLHKRGYSFFTIGALTYAEIQLLVIAWNNEQREKEKSYKNSNKGRKKK